MTNKVIVALDNKSLKQIVSIVKKTKSEAYGFKIGKEFFYNYGIEGYKKIYKLTDYYEDIDKKCTFKGLE